MQIFINDSPVDCTDSISITRLLEVQGIRAANIAVAMDNIVIPKAQWDSTIVKANSNIIIIKAVQGG